MILDPDLIAFRRLTEGDLPLMHRWLTTEHVARWYRVRGATTPSLEFVTASYLPRIRGDDSTRSFIIMFGRRPIGYVQAYFIADDPEYAAQVQVEDGAAGIDLFIGEPDLVNRGLGRHVVSRFVKGVVFGEMGAAFCIIGPEPENEGAIRAYEKAGFLYLKTVATPGGDAEYEYLMIIDREMHTAAGHIDISSDSAP